MKMRVVVHIPLGKQEELNYRADVSDSKNLYWRDLYSLMNISVTVCTFEVHSCISLNLSFNTSEFYLIENKPFVKWSALQNACDICAAREPGDIHQEQMQINTVGWGCRSASTNITWRQRQSKWAFFHLKHTSILFCFCFLWASWKSMNISRSKIKRFISSYIFSYHSIWTV